jgi:hypothetical protein
MAFEPDQQFDSLTQAAFILGQYALRGMEHSWAELGSGLVVPREIPKYLFRGECGDFPTTVSSARRPTTFGLEMDGRWFPFPVSDLLRITDELIWRFQQPHYDLDTLSAVALLQHYGIPTTMIDFTRSLETAFAFAAKEASRVARVAIMPRRVPPGLAHVIDMTAHTWAVRPVRQTAFGVLPNADLTDLKSEEARSCLNVKWYQFPVLPTDRDYFAKKYRNLVAMSGDPTAGFLRFLVTEYVEARGKLSPALTNWLVKRIPMAPHCYLVKAFERNEVVVNYRDKDVLRPFDEDTERKYSERYWSSDHPEWSSWDRMKDWKWPGVGEIVADPRTYHPEQ